MINTENEEVLFQHARSYRFNEFDSLFREMEGGMPSDTFSEAYLMRAQIKLYTADLTILDDLEKAMKGGRAPQFPPLINSWESDGNNHFITFPKAPNLLKEFVAALPAVREKLSYWYGTQSDVVLMQLQGEIRYFSGYLKWSGFPNTLGERLNDIQVLSGSFPLFSAKNEGLRGIRKPSF